MLTEKDKEAIARARLAYRVALGEGTLDEVKTAWEVYQRTLDAAEIPPAPYEAAVL